MVSDSFEDLEKFHEEWNNHWMNRPDDYTLAEWLDKFWDDRGGRDLYFPTEEI